MQKRRKRKIGGVEGGEGRWGGRGKRSPPAAAAVAAAAQGWQRQHRGGSGSGGSSAAPQQFRSAPGSSPPSAQWCLCCLPHLSLRFPAFMYLSLLGLVPHSLRPPLLHYLQDLAYLCQVLFNLECAEICTFVLSNSQWVPNTRVSTLPRAVSACLFFPPLFSQCCRSDPSAPPIFLTTPKCPNCPIWTLKHILSILLILAPGHTESVSYNTQCRSVIPKIRVMSSYPMLLLLVIVFKHTILSMCLLQCELPQNSEKIWKLGSAHFCCFFCVCITWLLNVT